MTRPLTIEDFKHFNTTCELRYDNAYLIFDRTGRVLTDLREIFTDVAVSNASPQQTTFTANEGTFTIEIGACRFTTVRFERDSQALAKHCKSFFETVTEQLEIEVFTRIGLRSILRKEFKTTEESKAALASMMLANLEPTKRFNSSHSPTEVLYRWEDSQIGATVRLKAETTEFKLAIPPELQDDIPKVDRKKIGLTLDVDYYTVAPVDREQWNAEEWLPQKQRIIVKEVNGILQGGRR